MDQHAQLPSDDQVDEEVAALVLLKQFVRRSSALGDENHHNAIRAQIHVLMMRMDQEDVDETYGNAHSVSYQSNVHNAAVDALHWLEGERVESPSSEWKSQPHLLN